MKLTIILMLLLSLSSYSFAYQTTMDTLVTCEQTDGDQWIEVGIVLNDGPGLRALVVEHNDDNNEAKLIFSDRVVEVTSDDRKSSYYENVTNTFFLTVANEIGQLGVIFDGPNSINQENMNCFYKGTISFDKN